MAYRRLGRNQLPLDEHRSHWQRPKDASTLERDGPSGAVSRHGQQSVRLLGEWRRYWWIQHTAALVQPRLVKTPLPYVQSALRAQWSY